MKVISKRMKESLSKESKLLPVVPPDNGKQEVQTPLRHPSELPPAVQVKHAKYQLKKVKFDWKVKRHQDLASGIKERPIDVRLLFWCSDWFGRFLVWFVHSYTGSREFLSAHRAGYCSKVVREEREAVCGVKVCSSAFIFDSAEFCVSCNCSLWSLAKLRHKRRLAKLACPEGKYGKSKGWLGRCVSCLARKSSRESKRRKTVKRRKR